MADCDCLPDGDFAIKTYLNKYVTAEYDGDVWWKEQSVNGKWEKFQAVQTGETCKVGLRSQGNSMRYLRCPGKSDKVDQASTRRG